MSPGGRIVGFGRYPLWTATIYPFFDRLDVGVPVVFYAVPEDRPCVPLTPFVDRWWDANTVQAPYEWQPPMLGLDPTSMDVYLGVAPPDDLYPLDGTEDEWLNGCSYETYLAGGYSNRTPCVDTVTFGPPGIADVIDGISLR